MTDKRKSKIAEEAADLFLRLTSDPDNPSLIAERDAFCARGETEKKAFDAVRKAWRGVKPVQQRRKTPLILLAFTLGLAIYAGAEPVQTYLLADHKTQRVPETVVLRAGDKIDMDASTALRDETNEDSRRFTVLEGAVLFDVAPEARPFLVDLGPISVRVTGTVFETAHEGDALSVSVIEGLVDVNLESQTWSLAEGMALTWSKSAGAHLIMRPVDTIATWRKDRFVVNGMRFEDAVAVIDRRLPGPILVTSDALSDQTLSGIVDLSEPELALRTLAASRGARVTRLGPLVTVVSP